MLKSIATCAFVLGATFLSVGCAATGAESKAEVSDTTIPDLPPYAGPRAKVALRKFDWKVGEGSSGVVVTGPNGEQYSWRVEQTHGFVGGLEDLLTNALLKSNRYWVMERMEFDQIKDEVGLAEEGWVAEGTGPERGTQESADLAIYASVVEWEPDAGGSSSGGVGGAVMNGFLGIGGLRRSSQKGICAISIRLIDMRTSRTLASEVIRGEATSSSFSLRGFGLGNGMGLGGGLSEYEKKPMGAAIQKAIALAVTKIVESTPERFLCHE